MTIKDWQKKVNETARNKGWWDGELAELSSLRMLSICALIHSEVSEATECIREQKLDMYYEPYEQHMIDVGSAKPQGLPSELADIMIRVLDFAEQMGINLEEAIRIKDKYNSGRSYRHGGKTV